MGLEIGTYIDDLVTTNPIGATDPRSQGDDHLRLIKSVLRNTFPRAAKAFPFPDYKLKTADYSILDTDANFLIGGDATTVAVTLTLPTLAAADAGWQVAVVALNLTNALTVSGTINGDTNFVFGKVYEVAFFVWSGTAWYAYAGLQLSAAGVAQLGDIACGNITSSGNLVAVNATLSGLLDLSTVTDRMKLPQGTTAQRPGTPAVGDVRYNTTDGVFEYYDGAWRRPSIMRPLEGFFRNLSIKVASNTTVAVVADGVIVSDGVSSKNIALNNTINLGTTGADALDTGTIAAATFYYVWAIAKADGTVATLASLQSTANATFLANLPAGYTFYARIGAVRTAAGVAQLMGTWQFGRRVQYVVGLAQTSAYPTAGSTSSSVLTAISVASDVPPVASVLHFYASCDQNTKINISPNNSTTTSLSVNPSPFGITVGTGNSCLMGSLLLESTNIYAATASGTITAFVVGWEDNL